MRSKVVCSMIKWYKTATRGGLFWGRDRDQSLIETNEAIHSGRLTWNLKMMVWKVIFLFNWVVFRFHVNLPGCMFLFLFSIFGSWITRSMRNGFHWDLRDVKKATTKLHLFVIVILQIVMVHFHAFLSISLNAWTHGGHSLHSDIPIPPMRGPASFNRSLYEQQGRF